MKRRIILATALFLAITGTSFAQQSQKKSAPKNWHLLSFASDSVYGIGAEQAYKELLKGKKSKKVIVAVLDTGIDTLHEDLKNVMWTNKKEIAGNGIDDDKNGYTDDVHGWSFLGSRDGKQNVVNGSSEADREYIRLLKKYKNDTTRIDNPADKTYLRELTPKLSSTRNYKHYLLMKEIYDDIVKIDSAVRAFYQSGNISYEQVRAYKTDDPALKTAQNRLVTELYNQKGEKSIQKVIDVRKSYFESAQKKLTKPENADVYERNVVGDNSNDINDRFYGNSLLTFASSGHGTHVSGIIAAQRNNDNDGKGVADNVEIMTVRVVPQGDEYDKDIACGIRYAVDNGAKIINMSFGKGFSPGKQWVDDAFKYAESKGVLLVHAAGNDSKNLDSAKTFPSKHYLNGGQATNYISVGASTTNGIAAGFSNYGQTEVDIFAPGANILSTMPGNAYAEMQGTSMAAPVVSGVAALVWSYYPDLTVYQLKDIILKSATVLTTDTPLPGNRRVKVPFAKLSVTGGIVNAYNAVKMAEEMKTMKNAAKKVK